MARWTLGISESILHVYDRMERSLDKKALFADKILLGSNIKIAPAVRNIYSGEYLGFKTIIYGSSEELSHPSANVEKNRHVSNTSYDYDKLLGIKAAGLGELLKLRTDLLLAVEKARTKEQQKMIDSEVVQGDSYFGPGNNGLTGMVLADGTIIYSPNITPEERKRREQLSEVRLDLRTKCFAPVFYGQDRSRVSMSCVTAYKPEDLEKM